MAERTTATDPATAAARASAVPGETLLYINAYKALDLSVSSTGFRSNSLRHRALSTGLEPRFAEDFLVNTALRRGDGEVAASVAAYFGDEQLAVLSLREATAASQPDDVVLPVPVSLDLALGESVTQRRSRRIYTGDPMAADHLSALLRTAGGVTGTAQAPLRRGGTVPLAFRSAPSAGGLYPVDLYVVPLAVRSVPRGIYRYQRSPATLTRAAGAGTVDAVLRAFATTEESISLSRADVILLLVAQPWRVMRKYGPRGMRFVLMEAGAIAQNANLAAVALGYGSVECASVYDDEMNEALGLDGVFRSYVHAVVVGYPG